MFIYYIIYTDNIILLCTHLSIQIILIFLLYQEYTKEIITISYQDSSIPNQIFEISSTLLLLLVYNFI